MGHAGLFPMLFLLFWGWIIILGFKAMMRRFAQLGKWLYTPWGNNDDLFPTLDGSARQSWSDEEYRRYSAIEQSTPVAALPDVARDMEQALDVERRTTSQLEKDIGEWQNAIDHLKQSAEEWADRAATALAHGRNDLSRAAIVERQRAMERVTELEADVAEMRRLLASHSSDMQNLETKLSGIYRRNRLAETRIHAAETSSRTRQLLYGEQVKDALNRFELLERDADLAEGRAESLTLGSAPADPAADLQSQIAALNQPGGFGRKGIAQ